MSCSLNTVTSQPTLTNTSRTEPNPASDFTYTIDSEKVIITRYTGADGDVVIPEQIDGRRVIGIDDMAFLHCERLTTVKIPNGVTQIGGFTPRGPPIEFPYGPSITATLPSNLYGAFGGCGNLVSVTIPDSVTIIGDEAFFGCVSLTSVTLPNNLKSIGRKAFERCRSLTSINIPVGVTSIGAEAFYGCPNLTVTCPPNSYAHQYCVGYSIKFQLDYPTTLS
ncbi:MAG: leucine-rich repeat domain-containing protein [Dehalococcoidia bacterium]|nr:leucine-rich repeat domain-containing protein [Dehalococcoidia bacterium]